MDIVVENLSAVKDVFDRGGVSFWLEHGTLLGAVRDGKILDWDSDVDLGVWYETLPRLTATFGEFKKRGFNAFLNPKQGVMTVQKGDCNINLVLYRKRGNYAWTVWLPEVDSRLRKIMQRIVNISNIRSYVMQEKTVVDKSRNFLSLLPSALKHQLTNVSWMILDSRGYMVYVVIPKHYFENLSTISFYGMQFNVPSDVKKYLEYRYGADWRTPNKGWRYYKDDGAITQNWDALHFRT